MAKVELEIDGKIARIYLNRPKVLNAIDTEVPSLLSRAVKEVGNNDDVHVIILAGRGNAFCAGYDLSAFAQQKDNPLTQKMPWDPIKDYRFMWENNEHFMSLFHCPKPVICKIHGIGALAGGTDIALCSDFIFIENDAKIGYMPTRVWGTPTTAMWMYRLGPEKAKRMLFTGDKISGLEAEKLGLVLKSISKEKLDDEVDSFATRMTTVPLNQLAMQKILINQAVESSGLLSSQKFATIFDGISRHSREGLNFKKMSEEYGWKKAVQERDNGTYDWTKGRSSNQ